jgi:hypothetical protein
MELNGWFGRYKGKRRIGPPREIMFMVHSAGGRKREEVEPPRRQERQGKREKRDVFL